MLKIDELLTTHPVFADLLPEEKKLLAGRALRRELVKGEALVMQGDIWPFLFLVAEGSLDALKVSNEGRNLLVTTFRQGDLFWGLAFFLEGTPLPATLQANDQAIVYLWSRQDVEPVFLRNGKMGWELCHVMIQRMQHANSIVDDLAFQPVAGRLAHLLLDHFASVGDNAIERSLTLDEMAARVGTTREMVCRALYRFADRKLINVTRTEFVLTDRDGLSHLADGS